MKNEIKSGEVVRVLEGASAGETALVGDLVSPEVFEVLTITGRVTQMTVSNLGPCSVEGVPRDENIKRSRLVMFARNDAGDLELLEEPSWSAMTFVLEKWWSNAEKTVALFQSGLFVDRWELKDGDKWTEVPMVARMLEESGFEV